MSKAETKTERKPETKVERRPETREGETQRREVVEWYEVFAKDLVYLVYGKAGVGKTRLAVSIAKRDSESGRDVIYISTELNNDPLIDAIKKFVTDVRAIYKPYDVFHTIRSMNLSPGDVIIIDSLGGIRENWVVMYGKGNLSDVAPTNRLIAGIVHLLAMKWVQLKRQIKVILITHESPSVGRLWHGEDGAPTTAQHSIHDVSMVIRIVMRENYDETGELVSVERIGRVIMDRYNVIGAGRIFYLPQPVI
ncbi:MAG: ATP-binding protein [Vulcanisaeta sp.]|nr:ATP-binding protein [Vulcanisaeta sp.]